MEEDEVSENLKEAKDRLEAAKVSWRRKDSRQWPKELLGPLLMAGLFIQSKSVRKAVLKAITGNPLAVKTMSGTLFVASFRNAGE